MNGFLEYAAFASAVIASIGLALGLEWIGLNGLFRLMPGRHGHGQPGAKGETPKQR